MNEHEPDCIVRYGCVLCKDGYHEGICTPCICPALRAAYRRGINHERARIKAAVEALILDAPPSATPLSDVLTAIDGGQA